MMHGHMNIKFGVKCL